MNKLSKEEVDTIVRGLSLVWNICNTHLCYKCPMYYRTQALESPHCQAVAIPINCNLDNLRKHLEEWSEDDA